VSDLPESAREPECTCTLFEREGQFDPKCHYHGENGTMVVKVPRSVWDRTYRPPVSPAVEEEPGGISEEVIHAAYDAADATLETSAQGRWLRPAIEAALNAAWPFLKSSPAVEEPRDAILARCPDCDAPAGEPCVSLANPGQAHPSPHRARIYASEVARLRAEVERLREEWHVESIGGGITDTREEAVRWVDEWRSEYGDQYPIEVRRRLVGEWQDASVAALAGSPSGKETREPVVPCDDAAVERAGRLLAEMWPDDFDPAGRGTFNVRAQQIARAVLMAAGKETPE
jgi:hypothetical protein